MGSIFRRKNIVFYALALIAIIALLAYLFSRLAPGIDWREHYEHGSRSPYGSKVIFELLQSYFPGEPFRVLEDSLRGQLPDSMEGASYVFIGEALFVDSADISSLLAFVEAGNQAFISSKTIPSLLMFHLYPEACSLAGYWDDYFMFRDSMARLNFEHPSLRKEGGFPFKYLQRHRPAPYNWSYIAPLHFCGQESGLVAIGSLNDSLPVFARAPFGAGYFYLHTTPLAFSNIQLLEETGLEYATRTFSHLKPGPVYWDDYSRVPEWMGRRSNERLYSASRRFSSESPLQYILGQPPLAWGWYLLLGLGLLYMIFRARRRQRIIPVLEPNTNTSREFLATIGRLYFLQNNHRQLALQQMKLWQSHLREHYFIQARDMDEAFVEKLSHKSEIPGDAINKILLLYRNIHSSSFVSENTLIEFHRLLDDFYKNSK